jgi:hypothetical protein
MAYNKCFPGSVIVSQGSESSKSPNCSKIHMVLIIYVSVALKSMEKGMGIDGNFDFEFS